MEETVRMLTACEVAAMMNVEVATVRRWCRRGVIESVKLARTIRIPYPQSGLPPGLRLPPAPRT